MVELEEIHNCKKSKGKIVCITVNPLGITRCAYCNEIVDYSDYFKFQEAERVIEELENKEN